MPVARALVRRCEVDKEASMTATKNDVVPSIQQKSISSSHQLSPIRPEALAGYRERYERTLAQWTPVPEAVSVETRFGCTHVNAVGSPTLPPLILLHGFGFSSTQWYPQIPALAPHFRIYAPDVPDQFGLSTLTTPIQSPDNYALWMSEVMDGLGLTRSHLVAHSYGGWIATLFAVAHPERIDRLALIGPAGAVLRQSVAFYVRGFGGAMLANLIKSDLPILSLMHWMTTLRPVQPLAIYEQFRYGMRHMAPIPSGLPTLIEGDIMKRLTMPTLLIVGDHEVILAKSAPHIIEAARERIPGIRCVLVKNGGHAVTLDQPEATNRALLEYLIDV
jgi:pimeloyl-ACP methyl ester carboxylesterase